MTRLQRRIAEQRENDQLILDGILLVVGLAVWEIAVVMAFEMWG